MRETPTDVLPTLDGAASANATRELPRKWTLHRLNNGVIFGLTVSGARHLPRPASYGLGRAVMWLAWRLMRDTNAALVSNLRAVLPQESTKALQRRALDTYRSYALDTVDFLRAMSASPRELDDTFDMQPQDRAILESALALGRGAILITGHYGNWEAGGLLMQHALGLPLTVVAMAEANAEVNRLRHEIRRRMNIETLEVRQSLDTALQLRRVLAANRFVALLGDRHLGRDRVEVTLFGRRVWFLHTPALLAALTGAPLIPVFIERIARGRFRGQAAPPIHVDRDTDRKSAIKDATQRFATLLEDRIRSHPEFWYQFYPYWNAHAPDGVGPMPLPSR